MTTLLTKDQLRALIPVAPQFSLTVTLFGTEMPATGLKLGDYATHVFGRFESAQAGYVLSSKLAIADELLEAVEASPDAPADELAEVRARAARIQEEAHGGYLRSQALDAARANAAMVACGIGHPGDAEVETWLLGASDDELYAALEKIEHATWGDDPEGFFARLARTTAGRMLSAIVKAKAKKEAEAAAGSASRTTSTRTAGTASSPSTPPTSPNRKARRAQPGKPKPRSRKPSRT